MCNVCLQNIVAIKYREIENRNSQNTTTSKLYKVQYCIIVFHHWSIVTFIMANLFVVAYIIIIIM